MIIYAVDGIIVPGVQSQWDAITIHKSGRLILYSDWAFNTWTIANLPMSSFLQLRELSGGEVILDTNDYFSRNDPLQYGEVYLESPVNILHTGKNASSSTIKFRVKVT